MTYRRPRSDTVLLIFTAALVVYLVVTPLGMLIWNSLKSTPPGVAGPLTFDNFINAYIDPSLYPLVLNSFIYAIGSSLFGFAIAFPMAWLVERTNAPLRNLAFVIAIVATIILYYFGTRLFPENAWMKKLTFSGVQGADYVASSDYTSLRGMHGTALSFLRPAGVAQIGPARVDVLTQGEFIPAGAPIRVTRVEGARVFVEPLQLPGKE